MFYSHTFLARKGPLGTVWCAAHLEHKLRKSHYTSTDIPSTVERIMFPEVPIALRMSGHLLLGVVRIYSKKVEYLHRDCKDILILFGKAFAPTQVNRQEVNLPEDATHAPFHSVTLPDTFELDAMDLDDGFYYERNQDKHLMNAEEITCTDQIPSGRDPYIAITFDMDILRDSSHVEGASGSRGRAMEDRLISSIYDYSTNPSLPGDTTVSFQDPGPSNQTGINEDNHPQNFPAMEVMRDAVHDFNLENIPVWPDQQNDILGPDTTLERQVMEMEISPVVEEMLASGGQSLPCEQRQEPPTSVAPEHAPEISGSHISFGNLSPGLAIQPSPPAEQPQARRRRKRAQYDEAVGLTNEYGWFMKAAIGDSNGLLRNRINVPDSYVDVWKFQKRSKKEKIFTEPLISGLCGELCNIFQKDFISAKPHLAVVEESHPNPSVAQLTASMPDDDLGIERLRDFEDPAGSNVLPELRLSPNICIPSTSRTDDFTPAFTDNLGSQSGSHVETTIMTNMLPTPDLAASTGPFGSEMETPMTFPEQLDVGDFVLSDIPEVMNSAEAEDLDFLAEDNTPAGIQGTPGVDQLSARTRAVAQFIKRKSSGTPTSRDLSGDLILNKILEGKRRKICARMFFETLVLKTRGLVDVQQEEPYGDITLRVTSKLSKDQSLS
ncbi:sister chromatid cohesion 1 protein 3-like [Cornus florida]|uniref:sister chromatid cohesion 1 protein 3-like n=1 Tax=Cornus florida TaxID=4283 RepID=UPI0028980B95|nr:sister chromatid cohesion 1 protein 3-like [Cornus florida]